MTITKSVIYFAKSPHFCPALLFSLNYKLGLVTSEIFESLGTLANSGSAGAYGSEISMG